MFNPISQFKTLDGYDGFTVHHLFQPSWFKTEAELVISYQEMFDWLEENCADQYRATSMDNAAYSDVNEDPWVGYHVIIKDPDLAMAFKLRWAL